MSSLCRHLSPTSINSIQEIVNWVTTADGCVHTADTTQLNSAVESRWCVLGITIPQGRRFVSKLASVQEQGYLKEFYAQPLPTFPSATLSFILSLSRLFPPHFFFSSILTSSTRSLPHSSLSTIALPLPHTPSLPSSRPFPLADPLIQLGSLGERCKFP